MTGETEKKEEGPNRIMVFLRIRPEKKGEICEENGGYLMEIQPDNKNLIVKEGGGKPYSFDYIFDGPNVKQEDIFTRVAIPVIDNVFKGYWGTMMVYGQTGTGKSFTMCNFAPTNMGIIPRTMNDMFTRIESDTEREYTILFSFIQIYLDRLQDLFNPEGPELKINRDDKDGVAFPGIVEREVKDEKNFRELYEDGNQYRVITATKMNPESSRGHAALFIQIKSKPKNDDGTGEHRSGKLMLIDLAGYERFSKTGVQEGIMKEEAKTINASLLALGNVVQGLSEKSQHVPWRNSKLTRMLQDAIGGRAKCSIILTAGPSAEHYHETVGTLYFGARAMAVKTDAKLTLNVDYQKLAKKLQELLSQAEEKINTMEIQATQRQLEREQAEARMQSELAGLKKRQEEQLQTLLTEGASPERIKQFMEGNRVEVELLEEQHYQERTVMEEENERAIQEATEMEAEKRSAQSNERVTQLEKEINGLREKLKSSESEVERLSIELRNAHGARSNMANSMIELRINEGTAKVSESIKQVLEKCDGKIDTTAIQALKMDFDDQLKTVREMLEETHALRMQAVQDELKEEIQKFQKLYDESVAKYNRDVLTIKDETIEQYEAELEKVRRTSAEVQEKLKKNHMTIKTSYQNQREELQKENDALVRENAMLQAQLEGVPGAGEGASAATHGSERKGQLSRAELLIQKKQEERKVKDLEQKIEELQNELSYFQAEKFQMEKQLENYKVSDDSNTSGTFGPSSSGVHKGPPQSSALRHALQAKERLEERNMHLEKEILKYKAKMLMNETKAPGSAHFDEDSDDDMESVEPGAIVGDLGDFQGLKTFQQKIMRFCFLPKGGHTPNTFEQVLNSITTDLTEYRTFLRYRVLMVGAQSTGKTSVLKCLTTACPVMKSVPEVAPTMVPTSLLTYVNDERQGSNDLYQLYIKEQDLEGTLAAVGGKGTGMMSRIIKNTPAGARSDPAKVMLEMVDLPGSERLWEGMPPYLLPAKSAVYVITYRISQPIENIRAELERYLSNIHAAVHSKRRVSLSKQMLRVGVALVGTHRDVMREGNEPTVVAFTLQRIAAMVGEILFDLKREDTMYGISIIGSYAVSCQDWSVMTTKRGGPTSFRDLLQHICVAMSSLCPIRPANLVPGSEMHASSTMSFLSPEDVLEGENRLERIHTLSEPMKRLRKGVITFCSLLSRERRLRWITDEASFRSNFAKHIGMSEEDPRTACYTNFFINELVNRGLIVLLPYAFNHKVTMPAEIPLEQHDMYDPAHPEEFKDILSRKDVPERDCIICLDPIHLLSFTTLMLYPAVLKSRELLGKEDAALLAQLQQGSSTWQDGLITPELANTTMGRITQTLAGGDLKISFELACVMGLALQAKQENGVLSPLLFSRMIKPVVTDYLTYLLGCFGDGLARRYTLNACTGMFFHRLQTKLVPFSHAPTPSNSPYNWLDASYLKLQKDRFKWGVIGSTALKSAIVTVGTTPVRGFLKVEGNNLYVVVTVRSSNAPSVARTIISALHREITLLCRREFYGVRLTYCECPLSKATEKCTRITEGTEAILKRHQMPVAVIEKQQSVVKSMGSDPKGGEIDEALNALLEAVPQAFEP